MCDGKNRYTFELAEFQEMPVSGHDAGNPAFECAFEDAIVCRIGLDHFVVGRTSSEIARSSFTMVRTMAPG